MKPIIKEQDIIKAAESGMDDFVKIFADAILESAGGTLTAESMATLNAHQTTLLAYLWMRDEVMDGGFVQLIHNGYGPFIFDNPFAYMLKQWGMKDLSKLVYAVRRLWLAHADEITVECTDDEFMALFEKFPEFDDYDDDFVENEEEWTASVARYVDEHIEDFATVEKD